MTGRADPPRPESSGKEPADPLVALRRVTKKFPGVLANDAVDFDIYPGEVHALLGENGAGKSTLMKVLYGFYKADAGELRHRGTPVQIHSPHDARRLGIGMVFQAFTLIPALSVIENIALFLPDLPSVPDLSRILPRLQETSARYQLEVRPWVPVWQLSIGEQQKVEVLKLLLSHTRVLILDEPTRVLAPHEIDGLFQVFANLRRDGYAVVFITHKLHEVLACADRITVMRQGRVAGTLPRAGATEEGLLALMFGTAPVPLRQERRAASDETTLPVVELRQVTTTGVAAGARLEEVTLSIMHGEILGVAGVSGNGQRELGDLILGLERCASGAKLLFGEDATHWHVSRVRASGVAFIPEDPLRLLVPGLTVEENMALADTRRYARYGGVAIGWGQVRAGMARAFTSLAVDAPPTVPVGSLSGGNQQRLVLARELSRGPRLIVAVYPTRGLDVAGAATARELLIAARNDGAAVLLISEDLNELFLLSDRLIVLHRGRIVGTFTPQEASMNDVGRLMTGGKVSNRAGV